ncbi:MAG TPA: hypothetical protein VFB36_15565 [Nevskiaceae bacterium]|nr:hypothetical protein [Nevskiaceae bacterium]
MAGKKQQQPKPVDEDEEVEGEGWDNVADVDAEAHDQAAGRMRDWRDVEKYREMRELRRLVGDEFDFSDVLGEIPIRSGQMAGRKGDGKAKPAAAPSAPAVKGKVAAPPPKVVAHQKPAAAAQKAAAPKPGPHKPAVVHKAATKPAHKPVAAHKPPHKPGAKAAAKKAKAKKR